jgi:mRNA-binding protein PUF3
VLQRLLEDGDEQQKATVLDEICNHLPPLCQDMFGNYVVQHVLMHGRPQDRHRVFEVVRDHVVEFSSKKFASNVIEQTLKRISADDRRALVDTILGTSGPEDEPNPPVLALMRDRYGNYIVQRALDYCLEMFPQSRRQLEVLRIRFRECKESLGKLNYGKHLLIYFAKFDKQISEYLGDVPSSGGDEDEIEGPSSSDVSTPAKASEALDADGASYSTQQRRAAAPKVVQ